jgi:hypothetical protein
MIAVPQENYLRSRQYRDASHVPFLDRQFLFHLGLMAEIYRKYHTLLVLARPMLFSFVSKAWRLATGVIIALAVNVDVAFRFYS